MTATSLTVCVLDKNIFEFERRHPLPCDLDDILGTVGDLEVAVNIDIGDIAGVQVTAAPKLF